MPIYTPIAQEEFVLAVHALADQLRDDAEWQPDYIIGIGRGGLVPAVFLSHASGLPMLSVDYSSQVDDFSRAPLERLAQRTLAGERLLLVDDINDTGGTIDRIRSILAGHGADAANLRVATLIDNQRSSATVDYRARIIDRAVTKDWFIFPWEAVAPETTIAADAAAVPERIA